MQQLRSFFTNSSGRNYELQRLSNEANNELGTVKTLPAFAITTSKGSQDRARLDLALEMKEQVRMNSKQTIRVIKKGQGHHTNAVPQPSQGKLHPNRDVAAQVAGWIREFEHNRRTRSLRTFASLFEVMGPSNQT